MKRLTLSLLSASVALASIAADPVTAADVFKSAPISVFPLLSENTRLDMLDYFNSGLSTSSKNNLEGTSAITALTPEILSMKMTDSSSAQIYVTPTGVITLVNTVAAPGLDSNIRFFDSSWNPLPTDRFFAMPGIEQWLTSEGKANKGMVTSQVPFMLASIDINPDGTLVVNNNLSTFLDKDVYALLKPYLLDRLTYRWTGKRFAAD